MIAHSLPERGWLGFSFHGFTALLEEPVLISRREGVGTLVRLCLQSHTRHSCELPGSQGEQGSTAAVGKQAALRGGLICCTLGPAHAVSRLSTLVFPAGH